MPHVNPMSNEMYAFTQKKTERLREIEEEDLTNPQQLNMEEEFKRIEKFEGDVAHRILPEIIRLAGDESKKIDKDLYNYIVKGRYIDPSRRVELYAWVRNTVFKYDEFVVALERLDDKKTEFIKKQQRLLASNKEKIAELTEMKRLLLAQIEEFRQRQRHAGSKMIPAATVDDGRHGENAEKAELEEDEGAAQDESEVGSQGDEAKNNEPYEDLSVQTALPIINNPDSRRVEEREEELKNPQPSEPEPMPTLRFSTKKEQNNHYAARKKALIESKAPSSEVEALIEEWLRMDALLTQALDEKKKQKAV